MIPLYQWATRWQVSEQAMRELLAVMGIVQLPVAADAPEYGKSEAWAASQLRLEAASKGIYLTRNNNGALKDERGRLVRYGLANESKQVNEVIKSADYIGIRTVIITPEWVGKPFGQFVSREVKEVGWSYTGQGREPAQLAWAKFVISRGGDAAFCTGAGSL